MRNVLPAKEKNMNYAVLVGPLPVVASVAPAMELRSASLMAIINMPMYI